jgi:hypothetical protein
MGDALADAIADTRPISRVEWHTIPLPGITGYLGGVHSLLAITVGIAEGKRPSKNDQDDHCHHTYVIEKAALIRGTVENDPEQFKNGVHVSHWVDVLPNVENDALYTLGAEDITNNTGTDSFSMRTLRDICVDLGPYDVGGMNCHHAAIAVYNACAKRTSQVPCIPNSFLTSAAWCLAAVGVDVRNSGSASIQSTSISAQSESISVSVPMQSTSASLSSSSAAGRESNLYVLEDLHGSSSADREDVERAAPASVAVISTTASAEAAQQQHSASSSSSRRRLPAERRSLLQFFFLLPCVKS